MLISITVLFLMLLISIAKPNTILNNKYNSRVILFILFYIVSINVISRDFSALSDAGVYVTSFLNMHNQGLSNMFIQHSSDPLFSLIMWVISRVTVSHFVFFAILWFIFIFAFLKAFSIILLPNQELLVFFSFTMYYFFYSIATNVLRQGLSISFLFIVLSYYLTEQEKKKTTLFLLLCACLFHWSAVPFAAILLIFRRINIKIRTLLIVWVLSAFAYLTNIQQTILIPLLQYIPKLSLYLTFRNFYGNGVNRLDFLLFSSIWVLFIMVIKGKFNVTSQYNKLIKVYIAFNTVFLLMGFIPFSDRIGLYSWMLVPLIVWLPIFNTKKFRPFLILTVLIIFLLVGIFSGEINYYKFI
ncbi:EpsG family protein [Clostridium estertheticum]|uniref:EpsG family protein n=1 Tax=Clostridium estertheticum TaxID=238834 RepID=UPI001CF33BA0|nr:EpsG family protein [Clostridium estertheticum]MCB2339602.1 EpsG family protein [Clostridium estertheticum]